MPVGLVRKWTVVAIIAASLGVIACKDDDADEPRDSGGGTPGGQDSGGSPGGGQDAATDSGGGTGGTDGGRTDGGGMSYGEAGTPCMGWDGGPVTCGTNTCYWHRTPLTCSNPGCIALPDGGPMICGIDTTTLGGVDAGLPPLLPYNAPGVDSPQCANLVDSFEDSGTGDAGTRGNGRIDVAPRMISGLTIALSYEGCCTPTGYCSGNVSKGLAAIQGAGGAPNASNAGYGCLDNRIFFSTSPSAQTLRCNPQTGDLVSSDGGASDGGSDAGAGDSGAGDGGGNG